MITIPYTKKEYEWVQYTEDEGMATVREIVTRDIAKVYSQSEALGLIEKLKRADK